MPNPDFIRRYIKKAADQVASLYALLVYHAGICMVVHDESFAMNPSWLR